MFDRIIPWIMYQIRKPFYHILYGKRFKTGKKGKVYKSTSFKIDGKNASIVLGAGIHFRALVEIKAFNAGNITIGNYVFMNKGVMVVSAERISIGNNVTIGPYTCIYDHDHAQNKRGTFITSPIVIEDDVWIGANVTILKGVHIGQNAIIGAGSIVTHDVPSNSIYYEKRIPVIKQL